MTKSFLFLKVLSILFFLGQAKVFPNATSTFRNESIEIIEKDTSYVSIITIRKKINNDAEAIYSFNYSELEKIKNISAHYFNVKGKSKDLAAVRITNQNVLSENFYDGIKTYIFDFKGVIEYPFYVVVKYEINCKELPLFCTLSNYGNNQLDSFFYSIKVPQSFKALFEFEKITSIYKVDSVKNSVFSTYNFGCKSQDYDGRMKSGNNFFVKRNSGTPPPRVLLYPKQYANPYTYFNAWYWKLIKENLILTTASQTFLDEQFASTKLNEDSLIKAVFLYVKDNFHYLSVENGLGAFQCRNVNSILTKRQGDCKDFAAMITSILTHFSIKANLCIIGNAYAIYGFDFPSLASGNHAICVVQKKDGTKVFLDATDKVSIYPLIAGYDQGRPLIIIDSNGYTLTKCPIINSSLNVENYVLEFWKKEDKLSGKLSLKLDGLSQCSVKEYIFYLTKEQMMRELKNNLLGGEQKIDIHEMIIKEIDGKIEITADVECLMKTIEYEKKKYLPLLFMPFPLPYNEFLKENDVLVFHNTIAYDVNCIIHFEKPIKLKEVEPISLTNKLGYKLNWKVTMDKTSTVKIGYSAIVNDLTIEKNNVEAYNTYLKEVKKTLNYTLVYED